MASQEQAFCVAFVLRLCQGNCILKAKRSRTGGGGRWPRNSPGEYIDAFASQPPFPGEEKERKSLLQRNQKELVEKLLRMHILLSPLDSMKGKGMRICVICISSLSVQ
ncbi:hypothetical protein TNIN_351011 [Trichonephila inaurata madagascariensis]|uniref:Uncharacterized protein n=1 Tax=Trichonephila inaurata madagascariensis TaxID=2747483 RepID=A0A8X6YKN0_9ARAC|nr:hypothetical protein TNIN_351011 [Trichonephila inaurata madagascariensis]